MSEQYTPGPWRADESGRDVRSGGIGGLFVARIYAVPHEDNPSVYTDEQVANARLIAAAPELYEALKTAREALKANEEITGTWDLYQHSPEMKAINAALAKAEGRSEVTR